MQRNAMLCKVVSCQSTRECTWNWILKGQCRFKRKYNCACTCKCQSKCYLTCIVGLAHLARPESSADAKCSGAPRRWKNKHVFCIFLRPADAKWYCADCGDPFLSYFPSDAKWYRSFEVRSSFAFDLVQIWLLLELGLKLGLEMGQGRRWG